MLRLEKEE